MVHAYYGGGSTSVTPVMRSKCRLIFATSNHPDDRLGEVPIAVVEGEHDAAGILERVAPRLAPFKRPRRVFVVESLPLTAVGAIDGA